MKQYLQVLLVCLMTLGTATKGRAADELTLQLQKGLLEEEAHRNYGEALKAYQAAVAAYDTNRQAAATAVFRLAETYRKLGKTNEARVQYERVVREFSDQTNLANLSWNYVPRTVIAVPPAASDEDGGPRTIPSRALRIQPGVSRVELPVAEQTEIERLKLLIKNSPDLINAKAGENNRTPLQEAATKGQLYVAQFLLTNGAKINLVSTGGETPLHMAAQKGHKAMVELLLSSGADIEAKMESYNGRTALHSAAEKGFGSVVELLLAKGAQIDAQERDGYTALHFAVLKGNLEMVQTLISKKADVNLKVKSVSVHQPSSTDVKRSDWTALHLAARNGNVPIMKLLVSAGAEVDARDDQGATPLFIASGVNEQEAVEFLLSKRADPRVLTKNKVTALQTTSQAAIAEMLLKAGAEVNAKSEQGVSALIVGANSQNKDLVAVLLRHHADTELESQYTSTPLMDIVSKGNLEIARMLLEAKADPNHGIANKQNPSTPKNYPIQVAVRNKQADLAELLLSYKADATVTNAQGLTLLHYAVAKMDRPMVELLLKQKLDPNAVSLSRETPVTIALAGQLRDLNYESVQNGLLPSLPREPMTGVSRPLRVAPPVRSLSGNSGPSENDLKQGFREITELLIRYGGDEFFERRNMIGISRKKSGTEQIWAERDAAKMNQFSLFELLVATYSGNDRGRLFQFPDFTRLSISRLDGKNVKTMAVNLGTALEEGKCEDIWLEWGDIVEIPEADHNLDESWIWLGEPVSKTLAKCSAREVTLTVKGQSRLIQLRPTFINPYASSIPMPAFLQGSKVVTNLPSFILSEVVFDSRALQASSDTKRVKVIRKAGNEGKTKEMIYDIGAVQKTRNDLRLRDGDVIEVPEKE